MLWGGGGEFLQIVFIRNECAIIAFYIYPRPGRRKSMIIQWS